MNFKLAVATLAISVVLSTPAHALLMFDLSGVTADGAAFNEIFTTNTDTGSVTTIDFNFIYDAGVGGSNDSWGSELIVQIGHLTSNTFQQIGTQDDSCDAFRVTCVFDLGWTFGGVFNTTGSFQTGFPIANGSGDWQLTVADSFDDLGIDGVFLQGSFIRVNQASVPVTSTLLLMVIGLGAAAFGLRRRV